MADQPNAAPAGDGSAPAAGAAPQPGFAIERIYVKDLSLENPGAPQSFQISEPPSVELGLRMRSDQVGENVWECVLTLTVTATSGDKKIFLIEASQAGLFQIRGVPASEMQPVLMIACPNVLFPYARETIADATMRAGFPPVHLAPINFEVLYQQPVSYTHLTLPTN